MKNIIKNKKFYAGYEKNVKKKVVHLKKIYRVFHLEVSF